MFENQYDALLNQNKELQKELNIITEAFNNSTQLNNHLHDEIRLKDKMIELMAQSINDFIAYTAKSTLQFKNNKEIITEFNIKAQKQLVAEQNKKAACSDAGI